MLIAKILCIVCLFIWSFNIIYRLKLKAGTDESKRNAILWSLFFIVVFNYILAFIWNV